MQNSISDLIKGNVVGLTARVLSPYFARVTQDGGIYEAPQCVETALNSQPLLGQASLVLIPSGYKATKLYSEIPTSGAGDFAWTRASNATRINSSGAIETMANNVPRLDYSFSSCPMALLETQRTNLVFPSATATTQTRAVTSTAHTLSFYGTGTVVLSGVAIATLSGTGANDRVSLTFTPSSGNLILTVTGTVTNWQLEAGSFASTLIPTTSATATRLMDECVKTGISSLIGQSEGTIFAEVYFTQLSNAGFRTYFQLEGSVPNQFGAFTVNTTNNGNNVNYAGSSYTLTTGRHKIACTYSQANNQRKLFVDGVLRATSTHTNFLSTIDRVSVGCRINPSSSFAIERQLNSSSGIFDFALFNSLLSDADCVALTT
jgi:hypothetical protein